MPIALNPSSYAPQLNLIERLWRYLKLKSAYHRRWNDLDRPLQAIRTLWASLEVRFHATDDRQFPHRPELLPVRLAHLGIL